MNNRDLKRFIQYELLLEKELIELLEGCFKEIFRDEAPWLINELHIQVDNLEEYGCVQSIDYFNRKYTQYLAEKEKRNGKNV